MAAIRTEITEVVTGLAMLGYSSLERALSVRPRAVVNVSDDNFDRIEAAWSTGDHEREFATAWDNGWIFARSEDGLRGRPPWLLEWKGPHKPPGYEQVPADLRIDHVYLVSCKYGSNILHNVSPSHLFDRALAERRVERGSDWFESSAPEAYQQFYDTVLADIAAADIAGAAGEDSGCEAVAARLPASVLALEPDDRTALKAALPKRGRLPEQSQHAYESFALAVAQQSTERWLVHLDTRARREEMLWRLLRLQAAPYFVLGATTSGSPLRYRVGTPWDFRNQFEVRAFDVWPDAAGQPLVRWRADITNRTTSGRHVVEGHVEIRWTHGRFGGAPEAKVHLDTHPHDVAGYFPLAMPDT